MTTKMLRILPLVAVMALSGCVNLAPDHQRPEAPVDAAWPQDEAYAGANLRQQALPVWQEFFTDERLRQVIELALKENRDLRVTALNVEKARAMYGVQRSELFPTVAAAASNAGKHTPASVQGRSTTTHTYTAQLAMASYEIDFFGRVRNLNEQALQAYLASDDARRSMQSTLIAQVAMGWLTLGADQAQLELQKETLKSQEESFKLIEDSYRLGAASQLDYEQARTTVAAARAQIASYIRAVAQDKNALNLLCGGTVPENLLPTNLATGVTQTAVLPEGLPSEVLLNRPDIMASERQLRSAEANIGVARAAFFPSVSLTAGAGSMGMHMSDLFDAHTGFWSFTPSINLPIFTGGRNLANLEAAKVGQKIAVANYEKAIQGAFREVADALATEGTMDRELNARREYADAATKAYELANASYKAGAVAYNDVLTSQRAMVGARQALIGAELGKTASAVTLYKVLGGGTNDAIEPNDKQGE